MPPHPLATHTNQTENKANKTMALSVAQHQLIQAIEQAFDGVTLGQGISLNMTEYLDSYQCLTEFRDKAAEDERLDWRRIPDQTLESFTVTFSFTDLAGFRFYIPAYMIWTVKHHADSACIIGDYTIYALDPDHYLFAEIPMVDWFTPEQYRVMIRFLEYCGQHGDTCDAVVAQRHLHRMQEAIQHR